MKFHTINRLLITTAGLTLAAGLASAGTLTIDDFSKNSFHQANVNCTAFGCPNVATDLQTGIPTANTIGGTRNLNLNVSSGTQNDTFALSALFQRLSLSLGPGDVGVGTVTYDKNGAGLGTEGNLLTNLGGGATAFNTFFQAIIYFSDLNLGLTASFTDTGNDVATYSVNLGAGVNVVNQAFASFTNSSNVDFDNIKSISVALSGPAAQDGTISFLEITTTPETDAPEPATMGLFGSALVGLGLLGRKRLAR